MSDMLEKKDMPSGSELMSLPGSEAELVLNSLSFDQQLTCVLQVPWKERMDVIMQSHSAREIVQALPSEEVFWMIKQRGVEDSLPVIARTTHEQFQYLIDLDCWKSDLFIPEKILSWYRMLGRCNIAKVLEWFEQVDNSLLVTGLKSFVNVHKIEEESDISEEYESMPPCTLDGINFFRFATEESQVVLLPLLKVLRNNDNGRFQSLIEGLIWDSRIEAEDEALHWRQSRIAENGFPLFDEALGIYQVLAKQDMQPSVPAPSKESVSKFQQQKGEVRLRYALSEDRLPDFVGSVLPGLDAEQLERFEQLLITLANKVMVADCMEVRDVDDVRRALRKTAGYASIGLEHLSAGDTVAAQKLAAEQHPEILFRCGFSLVNEIAMKVRQHKGVIWTDTTPRFISFYGTPLADTALGLVRGRPLFYEGLVKPGSSLYRDFETLDDVQAAAGSIDQLLAAENLLFEHASLELAEIEDACIQSGAIGDHAELTSSSLLATMLIAQSLYPDKGLFLLDVHDILIFAQQILEIGGQDMEKGLEIFTNQALTWLKSEVASDSLDQGLLRVVVQDCLASVSEILDTYTGSDFDACHVSGILIKRV